MVDITKEELWGNKDEDVSKRSRKVSKLKELIEKYKWISILLVGFLILTVSNVFLIYNFFKMFSEMR